MSITKPNLEGFGSPVFKLSPIEEENTVISAILNEARHVFDWHKEALWKSEYKDGFARLLIPYLTSHPKLIPNINKIGDRVFSMVVYRAVELMESKNTECNASIRPVKYTHD
jgi:hypothetical protein